MDMVCFFCFEIFDYGVRYTVVDNFVVTLIHKSDWKRAWGNVSFDSIARY